MTRWLVLLMSMGCAPPFSICGSAGPVEDVGRLPAALEETSGLVWDNGGLWAVNDGPATTMTRVATNGESERLLSIAGVTTVDAEDLAYDPVGPSFILADIGDEDQSRRSVQLIRLPAQVATPTVSGEAITLLRPNGYADDMETSIVDPWDGSVLLVGRNDEDAPLLYAEGAARLDDDATVQLTRRGRLPLPEVSGGDISRDGRTVVLRTLTSAWFWYRDQDEPLYETLQGRACQVPLSSDEVQGESIALGPGALYSVSEGVRAMLHRQALSLPD